jgi:hypothetical protein
MPGTKGMVELLLEKGADVEGSNFMQQTALCAAAKGGIEKVIPLLLAKGADLEAKDKGWIDPTLVGCLQWSRGGCDDAVAAGSVPGCQSSQRDDDYSGCEAQDAYCGLTETGMSMNSFDALTGYVVCSAVTTPSFLYHINISRAGLVLELC